MVKHSSVRLIADAAAIYRPMDSPSDAALLQADLDQLALWEHKWQMEFHPKKCKVMHMTRATSTVEMPYVLRGHTLDVVSSENYLGVKLDNRLSWSPHINAVAGKGNGKLSFLRRNLKIANKDTKAAAYRSLCRPNLEYCCTAWSPHQVGDKATLEKVQRKAARFVNGDYRRRSSPSQMIEDLEWESLETRRLKHRISLTYRIIHSHVAIPLDRYFRLSRKTRACIHPYKLIVPHSGIDYQDASFFYQVPPVWNLLPLELVEPLEISVFKTRLAKFTPTELMFRLADGGQQLG